MIFTFLLDSNSSLGESVALDQFEIGVNWKDVAFKVDGLKKGFNHMTDWTLNQVSVNEIFVFRGCHFGNSFESNIRSLKIWAFLCLFLLIFSLFKKKLFFYFTLRAHNLPIMSLCV